MWPDAVETLMASIYLCSIQKQPHQNFQEDFSGFINNFPISICACRTKFLEKKKDET